MEVSLHKFEFMKKVLYLDSVHQFLEDSLVANSFDVEHFSGTKQDLLGVLPDVYGLVVRSKFVIDREIIDAAKCLRFIARAGAGMENIDVDYAESKGISCLSSPEGNRDAVGEQTLGMLLNLMNNISRADKEIRNSVWKREANRGVELTGKNVGIVGYGNMGSAFAEKIKGFNCNIFAVDKYKTGFGNSFVKEASLDEFFQNSDVVSLHLPLTSETKMYADKDFFYSFKKPIWFLNTCRGSVCNTEALLDAIDCGKVIAAGLDVLEWEDYSFENFFKKNLPPSFQRLIDSDKVILTPHIAGWTHESNLKHSQVLFNKIMMLK